MTAPLGDASELPQLIADLILKFRQNGYWSDALLELEPHNREFVDSSSWAGELHWEAMQKLFTEDIMQLITQDRKQRDELPEFAKPGGTIPYETINGIEYVRLDWLKEQL